MLFRLCFIVVFFSFSVSKAQEKATVYGKITTDKESVPFAAVYVKGDIQGTNANQKGLYSLEVTPGELTIEVSSQGYRTASKKIMIKANLENSGF